MNDAYIWWGGFVLLVAFVYLVGVVLAYRRQVSPFCILRGHKFTFVLGDYHHNSDHCRRCGFKP